MIFRRPDPGLSSQKILLPVENHSAMSTKGIKIAASLTTLYFLAACAVMPNGPSVLVLPGTGKSFDQFRADDFECRQFASAQIGGSNASAAAVDSGVRSAAVGTVVGALAGAAINGSHGAGVGAGAGLLVGGLAGSDAADVSARGMQRRYDFSYQQCMYAKGHRVPVSGRFGGERHQYPQSINIPPPPPGMPPPPPSDAAPSR